MEELDVYASLCRSHVIDVYASLCRSHVIDLDPTKLTKGISAKDPGQSAARFAPLASPDALPRNVSPVDCSPFLVLSSPAVSSSSSLSSSRSMASGLAYGKVGRKEGQGSAFGPSIKPSRRYPHI